MKLKFDIIKKNLDIYDKAYNVFPQLKLHNEGKIDWSDIINLDLQEFTHFAHDFNKIKNNSEKYKVLIGETIIDFETLKKKMIKVSNKLCAKAQKRIKSYEGEYDTTGYESDYKELVRIKKLLKNITEEKLQEVFNGVGDYNTLFPYLWELELSIYDEIPVYINNYLVNSKVNVHKDVYNNRMESYFKLMKMPSDFEIDSKMKAINNSDEILDDFFDSINKSGSVNWDYLETKLKRGMNNLDKNKISKLHKINDRTQKIDKIVDKS